MFSVPYILIVLISLSNGGVIISQQEYNSVYACNYVANDLIKSMPLFTHRTYKIECVPKD
jgi:hypothetical protein